MGMTHVWSKGQVTIPARFRRELHLEESTPLKVLRIGQSLVLARQGMLDAVSKKFEREAKKKDISLEDLLKDLKKTRREINKEKYGI
jgi:AbrB family looped-hinge helix DNA binding protein